MYQFHTIRTIFSVMLLLSGGSVRFTSF